MIIDEFELAENILSTKIIKDKADLFVVAKYLRNEINCDVDETIQMLNSILSKSDKFYNPIKSHDYLEKISVKAASYNLKKVDQIDITNKEFETIQQIKSPKLQRLSFTLLVYAKYNNALSSDNNNWCNIKINDLYRISRVSTRNAQEKGIYLNKLYNLGLINFSKKNTNLNIQCAFVDSNKQNIKYVVDDIRELGYQYLSLIDGTQFTKCQKCGVIIKKKTKFDYSTKYCSECQSTSRNETLLKSLHRLD